MRSGQEASIDTVPVQLQSAVPLSFREVRFANAYLEHGNATQAARDAGYKSSSEDGLRFLAHKLLTKPNVGEYIRAALDGFLDAERVTTPRIAQALAREAFADRTAIFDAEGAVLPPSEWPAEVAAILVGYEVTESVNPRTGAVTARRVKLKFADPTKALKTLAEWRGMIGAKAVANGVTGVAGGSVTVIIEEAGTQPAHAGEGRDLRSAESGPRSGGSGATASRVV